mmetsp:Transcript_21598/g.60020  ORF Transcript_21598/g.60020 Transcript_21598/m.60020 type:complete len:126 (-) Transcript_21598:259-636(-)|eukprot:CAMPEP_0117655648 /NCGR_PEP_ID=MMETSP0804-20121206/4391_1 /TAXON_ID=1074897 /ORGANISM="Tetraselmis astigmatica, Strain CCMP880" /LENGTH=125 /DNA_ID=CAMNT_0005462013 /DNA_START=124 /DNA_END=501 /DNA_ORIENTATION=-
MASFKLSSASIAVLLGLLLLAVFAAPSHAEFCHNSAYDTSPNLGCNEVEAIKAELRGFCSDKTGVAVEVEEPICDEADGCTFSLLQKVESEEAWDVFSDCEHEHRLYSVFLEGKGADECKEEYDC